MVPGGGVLLRLPPGGAAEDGQRIRRRAGGTADGRPIREVVGRPPPAASFLECLRRRGWQVRRAENEVLSGIRTTAELLRTGRLVICPGCGDAIREFGLYRWDTSAGGRDQVCKEHDHAMDDIRYFAVTVAAKERGGSWAGSVERRIF